MSRARRWRRRFEGRRTRFERQVRLTAARLAEGDADLEEDLVQEGLIALLEAEGERGDPAEERWEAVSRGVRARMRSFLAWQRSVRGRRGGW